MRKIRVLLLANVEDPTERIVEIPDDKKIDDMPVGKALGIILTYGQNDFQPQKSLPSVGAGDAIYFKGTIYYGAGGGSIEITGDELEEIKQKSLSERKAAWFDYAKKLTKERGVPCETV